MFKKIPPPPPPRPSAERSRPPVGSASSATGSGAGAGACGCCYAASSDWSWARSRPPPTEGAGWAGAAAAAVSESSESASSWTGFGLGSLIYGIRGEPLRSITLLRVYKAFSIIGSTYYRIPNLRSKSWMAGIIFVRDCIFEKTFTSGWVSSSLLRILFVSAF